MNYILDYGVGNIEAYLSLASRLGIPLARAREPGDLKEATRIVFPGVGHFDNAMRRLNTSGLRDELEIAVTVRGVPILGVCVGMQMFSDFSEEGTLPGLGWISGRVRSFRGVKGGDQLPLPHMGWNTVYGAEKFRSGILNFTEDSKFYFLHSFFFEALNRDVVAATCDYGFRFDAAVSCNNIYGVQFHPEKSHRWGAGLLRQFLTSSQL
jgi:glutamine amidotransferase